MKYLHLLLVIVFSGLFIANYYYISINLRSAYQVNRQPLQYALRYSFYNDAILGLGIIGIPITCALLIQQLHFSLNLTWLNAAFWLCGISSLAWIGILTIKQQNYRRLCKQKSPGFQYTKLFHTLHIIVIGCLVITLHDAVFQSPLLSHVAIATDQTTFYAWIKTLHISSACLLFGTGIGTAFYMLLVNLSKKSTLIAKITSQVVVADWLFTGTSGVIQIATGLILIYLKQYSLTKLWVIGSIMGYLVAGICWVPVVYIQIRCRDIARAYQGKHLPPAYYRLLYSWIALGIPAFLSLMAVIYFMTEKPG